jgi:hypothetical protein
MPVYFGGYSRTHRGVARDLDNGPIHHVKVSPSLQPGSAAGHPSTVLYIPVTAPDLPSTTAHRPRLL